MEAEKLKSRQNKNLLIMSKKQKRDLLLQDVEHLLDLEMNEVKGGYCGWNCTGCTIACVSGGAL